MSNDVTDDDLDSAQKIWNYMSLNQNLAKSDIIIVFGNHDIRTAEYASKLWLDGWAKWLMFSGKEGVSTKGKWSKPEAEVFRDVALSCGIPNNRIIMETRATNTGQNVTFTYEVLKSLDMVENLRKLILVQVPYMERRVYATFMKQWPGNLEDMEIIVASPNITLLDYPNKDVGTLDDVIAIVMGCLYRIKVYPDLGFQIPQDIPPDVWHSYEKLLNNGYDNIK